MQFTKGQQIRIQGKYITLTLTADRTFNASNYNFEDYRDLLSRLDTQAERFEKEFNIKLLQGKRKNKNSSKNILLGLFNNLNASSSNPDHTKSTNELLATLDSITQSLRTVLKQNITVYNSIRKKLIRNKSSDSFYSYVFELYIARSLALSKVVFSTTEELGKPDYYVGEGENPKQYIECKCAIKKSSTATRAEVIKKVLDVIKEKENKKYAGKNGALFVDISNLTKFDADIQPEELLPETSKFSSIVIYWMYIEHADGQISYGEHRYRKDYDSCPPDLKAVLDAVSPSGEIIYRDRGDGSLSF